MAEPKLDIFRVLNAANAKDSKFYNELAADEQKAFQPLIVARWMSGTSNAGQIYFLNEFVNPYTFSLYKHPELLWKLTTVASAGKKQRYLWNKAPNKRETGRPNAVRCVAEYFGYSSSHAADAMNILTRTQIIEMAELMGWQQEEIAKIRRELKASDDPTAKPKRGKKTDATDTLEF